MEIVSQTATSPFDQIRQIDEHGAEYWSARDLMIAMEYARWENFNRAVERARHSAENPGGDHIADATKMVRLGSGSERAVQDYRLTRMGAYLVVMNGDPRNPHIAAAQQYFAVKTREAEVMNPAALDLSDPSAVVELAKHWLKAAEDYATERARRIELEGPAAERDLYRSSAGLQLIGDVANRFQAYAADRYPLIKVQHRDVWDHAGRLDLIIRGNTVRNNQPTSRAISAGWVKPSETLVEHNSGKTSRKVYTRLTPKGEARLWDGLIAFIENHGTLSMEAAA